MRRDGAAFTLTELAVVTAIVTITSALLLAGLTKAREHARSAACRHNLKSLGLSFAMYQADYDEFFPLCSNVMTWPTYPNGWGANWPACSCGRARPGWSR